MVTKKTRKLSQYLFLLIAAPVGGLIQVGPENLAIPATFAEIANDVYNFEPRKDDVWLAGYPRSGMLQNNQKLYALVKKNL